MKKYLITPFVTLVIFACKKETVAQKSDCFEPTIENFKTSGGIAILKGTVNGTTAYLLDRGARHFDGADYLINERCDTIGYICGECIPNVECEKMLVDENTVTIWKK
jgi:hypothetical protein